jgi:hypothetical protein
MNAFTIYDKVSGEILSVVSTTKNSPAVSDNQGFIIGSYDDLEYIVRNGEPVRKDVVCDKVYDDIMRLLEESKPTVIDALRLERNNLLTLSDWTQINDSPADSAAWATYRQELRNLPANYATISDINEVVWPEKPKV